MNLAELAAVITAAAGLVGAVTALVHSIQTRRLLQAPNQAGPPSVARAASREQSGRSADS